MRLLKSALFWRILVSFLLVVSVLGWGLRRATGSYENLEGQFDRLVAHDLKLADDAEVLLRIVADLETGKRGYLLTKDRTFLEPYERALRDLSGVLDDARRVSETGREDELVDGFARDLDTWITTVAQPEIHGVEHGEPSTVSAEAGRVLGDKMRTTLGHLRDEALAAAQKRERLAFAATESSRDSTTTVLAISIVLALALGVWIARDTAEAARALEEGLAATGRLEPLPPLPKRADELGALADSLRQMAKVLFDKDASLRATLAEREGTLLDLTHANAELAERDARARAYAAFVARLGSIDLSALARGGLDALMEASGARVGVVYLLGAGDRLEPIHASALDDAAHTFAPLSPGGLPATVTRSREAVLLGEAELGGLSLDLGLGKARLAWLLAAPIAVGDVGAGALVVGGLGQLNSSQESLLRDSARQLGVALHNAWTHDRLLDKSTMLEEQGKELERAVKVKSEFLAAMSHELRTPLSALIGFADLLLDSPREALSARARESLERIKRNGEHLLALINDLLDLARSEAGRLELRLSAVNVVHVARASAAEVDSLRTGKDLKLQVDVPPGPLELHTDAQRLKQILLNLLSNALKFTEKGEVVLSVDAEADSVSFEVRDTGIGIPADAVGELFREFHQLDAGDGRRFTGSGIGLALSRRLARALGGDIRVRSEPGRGSTFTLVLPRNEAAPALDPVVRA